MNLAERIELAGQMLDEGHSYRQVARAVGVHVRTVCGWHPGRSVRPATYRGKTVEERLIAGSVRDGECLRWTGSHNPRGYGKLQVDGRTCAAHRVAYEIWVGPIPDGLEIDHVRSRGCRFHDCIEPRHLEAVTGIENLRRAHAKTHCIRGHELAGDNLLFDIQRGTPRRKCRECCNLRAREARLRKQAAA